MKKILVLLMALFFELFGSGPDTDVKMTVFGPQKYVRTAESSNHFSENFQAFKGDGQISIFYLRDPSLNQFEKGFTDAQVRLNGHELISNEDMDRDVHFLQKATPLLEQNTISVDLTGPPEGFIIIEIKSQIPPPSVSLTATPQKIRAGQPATLSWNSTGVQSTVIEPDMGPVGPYGEVVITPLENTTYTIHGIGPEGVLSQSITVEVEKQSGPLVQLSATPAVISLGQAAVLTWTSSGAESLHMDNTVGEVTLVGSLTIYPEHTTVYRLTASGPSGSSGAQARITVTATPDPQPEGSFGKQYQDQIPEDAILTAYDPKRFSMLTGVVLDEGGNPLENVFINILDNPQYGTAYTDSNGRFSIPVEGGGSVIVVFKKQDYLEVHRQLSLPGNDVAEVAPIQMIEADPAHTVAAFDNDPLTIIRHRSSEVSDKWGTRACTLVMKGDNRVFAVGKDGEDIQELETITVRATEYTTLESMPAELPPNSAYTYCAELSVDGARNVRFEKPIIAWVDNFLGFDVGEIIPAGFYDRDRGLWVPIDNGMVIRLLDTDGDGNNDALDADGDGLADDMNTDGSFSDEVDGLDDIEQYPPGATFWRMALTHFSPGDFNLPAGAPSDAELPNATGIVTADRQLPGAEDCKRSSGSFVEERSRIIHEDIPITGTGLTLYYTSNRVGGYQTMIAIPASGSSIPPSLKRIDVRLNLAGNVQEREFAPEPGLSAEFYWDGTDYLGQKLSTPIVAHASVGFVYDSVFYRAGAFERAFAQPGLEATDVPARQEITLWKRSDIMVHPPRSKTPGNFAEGWTLSLQHHLNPQDLSILHKGDGTTIANNVRTISIVAGSGLGRYGGTNKPALETSLFNPRDVAIDRQGNIYIADTSNYRIRKIDISGIITDIAGNGIPGFGGDGGSANEASLSRVSGIAVNNAGEIFLADTENHRIRKISRKGIISTVAGTGENGYSGDNGPAAQAMINTPYGVACDNQGNLYIADTSNQRIRKVDPAGIITTITGSGDYGFSGDNGPAVQASLWLPTGVAVDEEGALYIVDRANHRIRKVDAQGIITTIAGNGIRGYSGDGGPAELAQLHTPDSVAVDRSGNVYISDEQNSRIRMVSGNGLITTVAGNGKFDYCTRDIVPATLTPFRHPSGIAIDDDGSIYIAVRSNHYIRKVSHPASFSRVILEGGTVFADPAGKGYVIISAGTHVKTVDLDSGLTLNTFEYDVDGDLTDIIDRFGNRTVISRDENKHPIAITSPYGITTSLMVDDDNLLSEMINPDGSRFIFEYDLHGLMTAKNEPAGNRFEHIFDEYGRLSLVTDDDGGSWDYARTTDENGTTHVTVTTAEGNITSYEDHTDSVGAYTSVITGPDNAETLFSRSADGLSVEKRLSCGSQLNLEYDLDPEFGHPYISENREVSAQGLENYSAQTKTYADIDGDKIPDIITRASFQNDNVSTVVNDKIQSIVTKTSPTKRTTNVHYNAENLLVEKVRTQGLLDTDFHYDDQGRLTSIVIGDRDTRYSFDDQGRVASISHAEDIPTTFIYDTMGRATRIERPDNSSIGFAYDENGNLWQLTTPSNVYHEFTSNAVNMKSRYQTPESGSYQYLYDRDRRLNRIYFPTGKEVYYHYDANRLSKIQTPEKEIDLSYACSSKIDSITDGENAIGYAYDGKLKINETLNGILNTSIGFQYNSDYLPDLVTYADESTELTYDGDGLLNNAGRYTIFRNEDNGLPETVSDNSLTLTRDFNGYGEIVDQSFSISEQIGFAWHLERDTHGRIIQKTETMDGLTSVFEYQYDAMGRLLTVFKNNVLVEEYQYGANGSRTFDINSHRGIEARNLTYSAEDHLLTAGTDTFQYDLDGFLVSRTGAGGITQYQYSARGELISVQLPDGTLAEYVHDPLGRRIAKKINNVTNEKYLWQGQTRLLAIFDENDNVVARFEYADGRVPLSMTRAGVTYYLAYDPVGSLRMVADEAGNVVKRMEYDAFGNIIADSNPNFDIWFGFAGGLHDRDIELVRFGHRDYDPKTGRWTAKDPIFFNGGDTDLYGYCLNDPVNYFDQLGLWQLNAAVSIMGIDFNNTIYEPEKGFFPNEFESFKVSTTLVGSGVQFAFDTPIRSLSSSKQDTNISLGLLSKYLGVTYNTELTRASINLGLGLGLPITFGTSLENFIVGLSNSLQQIADRTLTQTTPCR